MLEASLLTERMGAEAAVPAEIYRTNLRHMYCTPAQMIAHHTSNGYGLGAGDLLGTGTCSGPSIEEAACLLQRTMDGSLDMPSVERRQWLADGDTLVLCTRAEREGFVSIGFGEASGTLLPAINYSV